MDVFVCVCMCMCMSVYVCVCVCISLLISLCVWLNVALSLSLPCFSSTSLSKRLSFLAVELYKINTKIETISSSTSTHPSPSFSPSFKARERKREGKRGKNGEEKRVCWEGAEEVIKFATACNPIITISLRVEAGGREEEEEEEEEEQEEKDERDEAGAPQICKITPKRERKTSKFSRIFSFSSSITIEFLIFLSCWGSLAKGEEEAREGEEEEGRERRREREWREDAISSNSMFFFFFFKAKEKEARKQSEEWKRTFRLHLSSKISFFGNNYFHRMNKKTSSPFLFSFCYLVLSFSILFTPLLFLFFSFLFFSFLSFSFLFFSFLSFSFLFFSFLFFSFLVVSPKNGNHNTKEDWVCSLWCFGSFFFSFHFIVSLILFPPPLSHLSLFPLFLSHQFAMAWFIYIDGAVLSGDSDELKSYQWYYMFPGLLGSLALLMFVIFFFFFIWLVDCLFVLFLFKKKKRSPYMLCVHTNLLSFQVEHSSFFAR